MTIVVTGSLAYDYIMNFPGQFRDHILAEKSSLSVSFLVDSMRRMRGGVAGNIAYNLALLGERPLLVSTVGQDFGEYRALLERRGVDVSGLVEIDNEFTSSCFINTDQANDQIVAFYAGAMKHASELSLAKHNLNANDLVVISASAPEAMANMAVECQHLGIPYVFDPGKQTPRLEADQIRAGLKGARMLVGNDYEFGMMAKKLEMNEEDLIRHAPMTVVTRGSEGSIIYAQSTDPQGVHIPVAPATQMPDPTGAGDAYLAGLVFGLARGLPIGVTGRIAALSATYAVELSGCQEHFYHLPEFVARYEEIFDPNEHVQALLA